MSSRNKIMKKLYEDEYKNFIRFTARMVGSKEAAEDIVQEAFTRALYFWDSYDESKPVKNWFITILNNARRSYMSKERANGMSFGKEDFDPNSIVVEEDPADYAMLDKINIFIEKHPKNVKKVLELYFIKGYKPREIAEVYDMNRHSIRQYIWEFRRELKKAMK